MSQRKCEDWIETFVEWTKGSPSPIAFKQWSAISAIAGGLERKVSANIFNGQMYPNLYLLLVAPPGIGKTMAIKPARKVLRSVNHLKISPDSVTRAQFMIEMEESQQTSPSPNGQLMPYIHTSLTAMIDEFGVFVKPGDLEFMVDLTNFYDCPEIFEYKTKHSGENRIENGWFNLIGGCTPRWIKTLFTEESLEQGFPSRFIMLYEDAKIDVPLFGETEESVESIKLFEALALDLAKISLMRGEFIWTTQAKNFLIEWNNDGLRPYPMDPRLEHYCQRRIAHLVKLTQVLSASKSNELVLTLEDIQKAKQLLLKAEGKMHMALKNLGTNQYLPALEGTKRLLMLEYTKRGRKPVPEPVLMRYLMTEVPPQLVRQILDQLVASKQIRKASGILPTYLPEFEAQIEEHLNEK